MGKEKQAENKLSTGQVTLLVYVGFCLMLAILTLGVAFQGEGTGAAANTPTPTVLPMVLTIRAENAASDDDAPYEAGSGSGQRHGTNPTATPPADSGGQ